MTAPNFAYMKAPQSPEQQVWAAATNKRPLRNGEWNLTPMSSGFHRDRSKGLIGGVCAGLAEYFCVKPSLLRLTFVLWSLANEFGVAIYFVLWIILPEAGASVPSIRECIRRNLAEIQSDAVQWRQDLEDALGSSPAPTTAQIRRITRAGGLLILTGIVFIIDGLHLLSPFRLDQLGAIVWILIGIALASRALRI